MATVSASYTMEGDAAKGNSLIVKQNVFDVRLNQKTKIKSIHKDPKYRDAIREKLNQLKVTKITEKKIESSNPKVNSKKKPNSELQYLKVDIKPIEKLMEKKTIEKLSFWHRYPGLTFIFGVITGSLAIGLAGYYGHNKISSFCEKSLKND